MNVYEQGKDITIWKEGKNLEKLNKSELGAHKSHKTTSQLTLHPAKISSEITHLPRQLVKQSTIQ